MKALMACGHVAQGTDADGRPVCVICTGLTPAARQIVDSPDLKGRIAQCCYCGHEEASSLALPFFQYCPDKPNDMFYCGCRGWD